MCYDAPKDIKSTHPGRKNQTSKAPRLLQNELVIRSSCGASGSKLFLRPKLKNVLWVKDNIRRFTLPGGLVVNCQLDDNNRRVHKKCFQDNLQ